MIEFNQKSIAIIIKNTIPYISTLKIIKNKTVSYKIIILKNLTSTAKYKIQYLHTIRDIFSEKIFIDAFKSSGPLLSGEIVN